MRITVDTERVVYPVCGLNPPQYTDLRYLATATAEFGGMVHTYRTHEGQAAFTDELSAAKAAVDGLYNFLHWRCRVTSTPNV